MKVVFLDRDGVINENRPDHVKSWEEFAFLPGALDALRRLREGGWLTIVVTNQAIIHRNLASQETVESIHQRMREVVEQHGGRIDAVFYCPHRPEEQCSCRKPQPGMLNQAASRFRFPLDQCYMVGDALTDMMAAQAAGCESILVQTGRGREQLMSDAAGLARFYHVMANLPAAVRWMMICEERAQVHHSIRPSTTPWTIGTPAHGIA